MNRSYSTVAATLVVIAAIPGALAGCKRSGHTPTGAAASAVVSAAPAASVSAAIPVAAAVVRKIVNPNGEEPYAGLTGSIAGTITIAGDAPPTRSEVLKSIPADCDRAAAMYGKLFRVAGQKHLADALVTVTGYKGFVPARSSARTVVGRGCAWNTRTVALTYGQKLDVRSRGRQSYVPDLRGGHMASQMVALRGGSAVTLFPDQVGRYELADSMRLFMTADVLVLKYATFEVTGTDGRYEVKGVPAGGEVTVTAFLPAIMEHVDRKVKVEPGKTTQVDLQLEYKKPAKPAATRKPAANGKTVPVIR